MWLMWATSGFSAYLCLHAINIVPPVSVLLETGQRWGVRPHHGGPGEADCCPQHPAQRGGGLQLAAVCQLCWQQGEHTLQVSIIKTHVHDMLGVFSEACIEQEVKHTSSKDTQKVLHLPEQLIQIFDVVFKVILYIYCVILSSRSNIQPSRNSTTTCWWV